MVISESAVILEKLVNALKNGMHPSEMESDLEFALMVAEIHLIEIEHLMQNLAN